MRRTKANQKGKSRHFSTPEEIQRQMQKLDLEKEESSSSEEEATSSGSEESSSEEEDTKKPSGVAGLIQIENPNRMPKKPNPNEKVELSRREREELEKQRAKERYEKLHAAGKTDQAKADLARLALIRQKREQEAAKRREEAKMKEEEAKKKLSQSGRKTESTAGSSK